jgi:phospholipase D1/2
MVLESLSSNIKVIKHPGQKIPKWWSHHEKMVLIDQKIGFMGGLDLCFGRWDTNEHLLFD